MNEELRCKFDRSFRSFVEFFLLKRINYHDQGSTSSVYPKFRQIISILREENNSDYDGEHQTSNQADDLAIIENTQNQYKMHKSINEAIKLEKFVEKLQSDTEDNSYGDIKNSMI